MEMVIKLVLIEVLSKFEVLTSEKTEIPLKFSINFLLVVPEDGIWLIFKNI